MNPYVRFASKLIGNSMPKSYKKEFEETLHQQIVKDYKANVPWTTLCDKYSMNYRTIKKVVLKAGCTMRGRGHNRPACLEGAAKEKLVEAIIKDYTEGMDWIQMKAKYRTGNDFIANTVRPYKQQRLAYKEQQRINKRLGL